MLKPAFLDHVYSRTCLIFLTTEDTVFFFLLSTTLHFLNHYQNIKSVIVPITVLEVKGISTQRLSSCLVIAPCVKRSTSKRSAVLPNGLKSQYQRLEGGWYSEILGF